MESEFECPMCGVEFEEPPDLNDCEVCGDPGCAECIVGGVCSECDEEEN